MYTTNRPAVGRFAPSPTGRMHLGNVAAALMSWLSVKSRGGTWILRIEDLDPQRSRLEHAVQIEDDLHWLGLDWDEGGLDGPGAHGPYRQSLRSGYYERFLNGALQAWTYPCICTRADLLATQAPHQSDGRTVYGGRCLPHRFGGNVDESCEEQHRAVPHSVRLHVPGMKIDFTDRTYGPQSVDLTHSCGDFVLRRADGAWSYQLAVVADDIMMGVTEVVRGSDLLLSAAQQLYLYRLLEAAPPEYAHIPLLCAPDGRRLSKRDRSLSMAELRRRHTPSQVIGMAAASMGLVDAGETVSAKELLCGFDWQRVRKEHTVTVG